ncbi:hypothetical protein JCM11641_006824 [Rhodosporidiobolus odoratus]
MASSSTSSVDHIAALKLILSRSGERQLTPDDLKAVSSALTHPGESHTVALAVLSRFLTPSPTSTTLSSLQITLESLLSGTDSSELVQGLSVLSGVLQVAPQVVASLFQDNSLRSRLEETVEHISKPVGKGKGKAKQDEETLALVELLSLAAGQPNLRTLVRSTAGTWLESLLGEPSVAADTAVSANGARRRALAGVGVVKLRLGKEEPSTTGLPTPPEQQEPPSRWSLEALARLFVQLVTASKNSGASPLPDEGVFLPALEGLAYLTLTSSPPVKKIATDSSFLSVLFSFAPKTPTQPTATDSARNFAIATLLDHLTALPSLNSDSDAEQVRRLKRFASAAAKNGQALPSLEREDAESVTARIIALVKHEPSPIPTVRQLCLSPSVQTRRLAANILHSLVSPQPLRGSLLQAGAPRLFLSLIRQLPSPFSPTEDFPAVQGLAKLLITANPLLVLGPTASSPLLLEATTALTLPLGAAPSASELVGFLLRFESLMALTNISSLDPSLSHQLASMTLRDRAIPLLTAIEELLLSSNTMVRRAATELICNLAASDPGIEYFEPLANSSSPSPSASDSSKPPSTKLHLLLALSSSPDLPTRLAASGALTSLVYSPSIALSLVSYPKWVEILLDLLGDEEAGVRHRVYEVWRVIGEVGRQAEEERREKAREGLREAKVVEKLREAEGKEKVVQLKEVVVAAREAVEVV